MGPVNQLALNIYQLKRQFGVQAVFYSRYDAEMNLETGTITREKRFVGLQRCVLLPVTDSVIRLLGKLTDSEFKRGGELLTASTAVLFEYADLNGLPIKVGDYFMQNGRRFDVLKIVNHADVSGIAICHETPGANQDDELDIIVETRVGTSHEL